MPNLSKVQEEPGKTIIPASVTSLNGETGAVNIVAGTNITVTPAGQNITIASPGSIQKVQPPIPTYYLNKSGANYQAIDGNGNVGSSSVNSDVVFQYALTAIGALGGGNIFFAYAAYTMNANVTAVANLNVTMDAGVTITWGAYQFQINGVSNISIISNGGVNWYSYGVNFPMTLNNTNGAVQQIYVRGIYSATFTINNSGSSSYNMGTITSELCSFEQTIVNGTTTTLLPNIICFRNCFFYMHSANQAAFTVAAGSVCGQTLFEGCTFDLGANNTYVVNLSHSNYLTQLYFTDSDVTTEGGLTGLAFVAFLSSSSNQPCGVIDFQVKGLYLEASSPFTLMYAPATTNNNPDGFFSFENIRTYAFVVGNTLINTSRGWYSNTHLSFKNINSSAASSYPWILGTNLQVSQYLTELNCIRVDGVTDIGFGVTTPGIASGNPIPNHTGVKVDVYILTLGSGITAFAITDKAGTTKTFTLTTAEGRLCTLDWNESVTLTYTGAPSWVWKAVDY